MSCVSSSRRQALAKGDFRFSALDGNSSRFSIARGFRGRATKNEQEKKKRNPHRLETTNERQNSVCAHFVLRTHTRSSLFSLSLSLWLPRAHIYLNVCSTGWSSFSGSVDIDQALFSLQFFPPTRKTTASVWMLASFGFFFVHRRFLGDIAREDAHAITSKDRDSKATSSMLDARRYSSEISS